MAVVEVRNSSGTVVWQSPPVAAPLVEQVDNTVKVFDFDTGQVVATYPLKAGEYLVK